MSVDHQSSIRTQTKEVEEYEQAADLIETQAREIERLKEAIKVQASAVRTLQANEATEINTLRQQKREWYHAVSSLDSEREANAILTTEIERLREAIHMAMLELGSHGACPACFNAHSSLRDAFTKPGGLK